MFTIGAVTAKGVRLDWHCGGNDHVLTMGFHREKQIVKERESVCVRQRGRAVCTVTIMCVYENLWTIE